MIGFHSLDTLRRRGAIDTFTDLKAAFPGSISLIFLYALTAVLENRDWRALASSEKGALLTEFESRIDLAQTLELYGSLH